jgi:hypothetical protein
MTLKAMAMVSSLWLSGCVAPATPEGLEVKVFHLTGTSGAQAGPPPTADAVGVFVLAEESVLDEYVRQLDSLEDLAGDGDDKRELVVSVPADRTVSIVLVALRAGSPLATARVDGLRVQRGKRRFISMMFTPVNEFSLLDNGLPGGRFGHTTTRLDGDGRLLIAGGFTAATRVDCLAGGWPSSGPFVLPEVCFELEATDQAVIFDPASGQLQELAVPMFRPRALHAATALADGGVLVTGGVSRALLGLVRYESLLGYEELSPRIMDTDFDDIWRTAVTYEVFDPRIGREVRDFRRDGDLWAGAFVGTPDGEAARMRSARFLHGAAQLPGSSNVLLVGGEGNPSAASTADLVVIPENREINFEESQPLASATLRRWWPAVVTTQGQLMVIGGGKLASSAQLAETWTADVESGGQDLAASCDNWDATVDLANRGLVGPAALALGTPEREAETGDSRVLVAGWHGPLCLEGASTPGFEGTDACAPDRFSERSFILDVSHDGTCRVSNVPALTGGERTGHFLAALARLPSGNVLTTGGFSPFPAGVSPSPTKAALVATAAVEEVSYEANMATKRHELKRARAWHTATTLLGGRVLIAGGMEFHESEVDGQLEIQLKDSLEIFDPGLSP